MEEKLALRDEDIIVVKQLPVIEEQLYQLLPSIKERCELAGSLVATEENYKELKKIRADLNKERSKFKSSVKAVVDEVMAPLNDFLNGVCKEVDDAYATGISKVDGSVKGVESGLKIQKQKELFVYYEEYRQSLGLDSAIADPKESGIKVGLSDSMKSLKEQARQYLDRIDGDLKMIDTLDDADEVLAEYRQCMSVTDAVRIVSDRHKRIEDEKIRRMAEEENRKAREANEKAVEEAIQAAEEAIQATEEAIQQAQEAKVKNEVPVTPTVKAAPEETSEVTEPILNTKYLGYEIFGTLTQLKALKAFLKEELKNYLEREGMKYGEC